MLSLNLIFEFATKTHPIERESRGLRKTQNKFHKTTQKKIKL